MLHLQCRFGMDALSWVRQRALCMGADISPVAIQKDRKLAVKTKFDAVFVCSDVYAFIRGSLEPYDIVVSNLAVSGTFFAYPPKIRQTIYTTNAIESLNSVIRKAIKKRKLFPHDDAAKKVVYLATREASKRWTMPIHNWRAALNHFMIVFEERLSDHI